MVPNDILLYSSEQLLLEGDRNEQRPTAGHVQRVRGFAALSPNGDAIVKPSPQGPESYMEESEGTDDSKDALLSSRHTELMHIELMRL